MALLTHAVHPECARHDHDVCHLALFSPEWNRFHLLETDGALRPEPTP
ncbi:hypothetical protein BCEP4_640008 [Burkholderia cepacia]|nr:hypothetical protein BCEP4_640008 [Burkholderia cepacia]